MDNAAPLMRNPYESSCSCHLGDTYINDVFTEIDQDRVFQNIKRSLNINF